MDKIGDQIGVEILDPLLCASSAEQLAKTFERVFPKFRDYYISTVCIMWGFLQEDAQRFSALTIRSFQESEHLIRERGPHWIGRDASLNALHGLAAIIRIAQVATRIFDQKESMELQINESCGEPWANSIVAFAMAFAAILASLTALENRLPASVRLENVATLAHWSKSYAVQAYHFAKIMGLLKTTRSDAPVNPSEEEDLILADAGLDSYADGLRQDDQP